MQLVILLLLWRSLACVSESTITHASNVSKRQLQYGSNFPPPNYQAHGNQQANRFMQTATPMLYDPGYNAQHLHEVDTVGTDNTTDAAELRTPTNATQPLQQQPTQTSAGLDAQTFSHIYYPHAFAAGAAQHALSRTAAHAFPGNNAAALAARNSGRTYSTSSTYFVPLSVLYHPHAQAHAQQQQQQLPAYPPLPPAAALYQQYAPPAQPTAAPSIAAQSAQLAPQQQEPAQTISQQQTPLAASAYTPHALPPLMPRLPPLSLPTPRSASPLPLNFQAPFHPSQFLGFMPDRDTRNTMATATVSAVARAPQHTPAYPGYAPQQPQVEKPIYERVTAAARQQNQQAVAAQQARYIYMAPQNGYALFKAA